MADKIELTNEEKVKIRDQVGCPACKHYFTYYKHYDLCACSLFEVIDYIGGWYITFHGNDCTEWELEKNGAQWLANIDWNEEI